MNHQYSENKIFSRMLSLMAIIVLSRTAARDFFRIHGTTIILTQSHSLPSPSCHDCRRLCVTYLKLKLRDESMQTIYSALKIIKIAAILRPRTRSFCCIKCC